MWYFQGKTKVKNFDFFYSSIHSQSNAKYSTKLEIKIKTTNNTFVISAKFTPNNDGNAQTNNAKHKSPKANHHLFGIALIKAINAIGIVMLNKNIPIIPKTIDWLPNNKHGNDNNNDITQTFFHPNLSANTHHKAFHKTIAIVNIISKVQTFHG